MAEEVYVCLLFGQPHCRPERLWCVRRNFSGLRTRYRHLYARGQSEDNHERERKISQFRNGKNRDANPPIHLATFRSLDHLRCIHSIPFYSIPIRSTPLHPTPVHFIFPYPFRLSLSFICRSTQRLFDSGQDET